MMWPLHAHARSLDVHLSLPIRVHGDSLRKLQDSSAREDDVLRWEGVLVYGWLVV